MKKLVRFLILPILMFAGIYFYFFAGNKIDSDATDSSIVLIQKHLNGAGRVVDYYDEIGVESVTDIKLFIDDDKVKIEFGKIMLNWTLEDFVSTDTQQMLKTIGIATYRDKDTGKIRVFWNGEEIERWVS